MSSLFTFCMGILLVFIGILIGVISNFSFALPSILLGLILIILADKDEEEVVK